MGAGLVQAGGPEAEVAASSGATTMRGTNCRPIWPGFGAIENTKGRTAVDDSSVVRRSRFARLVRFNFRGRHYGRTIYFDRVQILEAAANFDPHPGPA